MKLSLDALLVLDSIEREGSFAAAAQTLHRVPSAITYTIQKLEQDLGVGLFDRSGHRARLTSAGQMLLKDGRRLLDAAAHLEERVQKQAIGWETELRITHSDLTPFAGILPLIEEFDALSSITRLRFQNEVYGGVWDALVDGRCSLALGATEVPPAGQFVQKPLGNVEFVFVVAPQHPLAKMEDPLSSATLRQHRAVAVGDTSRRLPPRSSSILDGQDVLTVSTMQEKVAVQLAGLASGFIPKSLASSYIQQGLLIEKKVEESKPLVRLYYAWKETEPGHALTWFLNKLTDPVVRAALVC
jgi:DNA-binding transcriptional LysR family regulator